MNKINNINNIFNKTLDSVKQLWYNVYSSSTDITNSLINIIDSLTNNNLKVGITPHTNLNKKETSFMAKNSSSAGIISGATANTGVTSSSAGTITGTVSSANVGTTTPTTATGVATPNIVGTTADGVGVMVADNGEFVDEQGNAVEYGEIEMADERREVEGLDGELLGIAVEARPKDYRIPSYLDKEPEYETEEDEDEKEPSLEEGKISSEELAKAEDEARKEIADLNAESPEGIKADEVNR